GNVAAKNTQMVSDKLDFQILNPNDPTHYTFAYGTQYEDWNYQFDDVTSGMPHVLSQGVFAGSGITDVSELVSLTEFLNTRMNYGTISSGSGSISSSASLSQYATGQDLQSTAYNSLYDNQYFEVWAEDVNFGNSIDFRDDLPDYSTLASGIGDLTDDVITQTSNTIPYKPDIMNVEIKNEGGSPPDIDFEGTSLIDTLTTQNNRLFVYESDSYNAFKDLYVDVTFQLDHNEDFKSIKYILLSTSFAHRLIPEDSSDDIGQFFNGDNDNNFAFSLLDSESTPYSTPYYFKDIELKNSFEATNLIIDDKRTYKTINFGESIYADSSYTSQGYYAVDNDPNKANFLYPSSNNINDGLFTKVTNNRFEFNFEDNIIEEKHKYDYNYLRLDTRDIPESFVQDGKLKIRVSLEGYTGPVTKIAKSELILRQLQAIVFSDKDNLNSQSWDFSGNGYTKNKVEEDEGLILNSGTITSNSQAIQYIRSTTRTYGTVNPSYNDLTATRTFDANFYQIDANYYGPWTSYLIDFAFNFDTSFSEGEDYFISYKIVTSQGVSGTLKIDGQTFQSGTTIEVNNQLINGLTSITYESIDTINHDVKIYYFKIVKSIPIKTDITSNEIYRASARIKKTDNIIFFSIGNSGVYAYNPTHQNTVPLKEGINSIQITYDPINLWNFYVNGDNKGTGTAIGKFDPSLFDQSPGQITDLYLTISVEQDREVEIIELKNQLFSKIDYNDSSNWETDFSDVASFSNVGTGGPTANGLDYSENSMNREIIYSFNENIGNIDATFEDLRLWSDLEFSTNYNTLTQEQYDPAFALFNWNQPANIYSISGTPDTYVQPIPSYLVVMNDPPSLDDDDIIISEIDNDWLYMESVLGELLFNLESGFSFNQTLPDNIYVVDVGINYKFKYLTTGSGVNPIDIAINLHFDRGADDYHVQRDFTRHLSPGLEYTEFMDTNEYFSSNDLNIYKVAAGPPYANTIDDNNYYSQDFGDFNYAYTYTDDVSFDRAYIGLNSPGFGFRVSLDALYYNILTSTEPNTFEDYLRNQPFDIANGESVGLYLTDKDFNSIELSNAENFVSNGSDDSGSMIKIMENAGLEDPSLSDSIIRDSFGKNTMSFTMKSNVYYPNFADGLKSLFANNTIKDFTIIPKLNDLEGNGLQASTTYQYEDSWYHEQELVLANPFNLTFSSSSITPSNV
ncbi:hypothetical protein LCGC14_1545280, partial [marine sediment metagenome]